MRKEEEVKEGVGDWETLQQDEDNSNIEGQMERTTQMLERGRSGAESIFP